MLCGVVIVFAYQNCSNGVGFSNAAGLSSTAATVASPVPTATPELCDTSSNLGATLAGKVLDATTQLALGGVVVSLTQTGNSSAIATATTDTTGAYTVSNVAAGTYSVSFAKNGYITFTASSNTTLSCAKATSLGAALSPTLAAGQLRIVLSWAAAPSGWNQEMDTYQQTVMDLDSYLLVPGYADPVFWGNCDKKPSTGSSVPCNVSGAYLDVDQVDWAGPETITISQQSSGTYTYYIANYSDPCNSLGITNSGVTVTVYSGSQIVKQYSVAPGAPPSGQSGMVYALFTYNDGVITDVNRYNDSLPTELVAANVTNRCDQYINQ